MKSNLVTFARNPFRVRGFRRPTPALLAGLTLMAGTTFVLHAQLTNIEKAVLLSWPEPAEEQIVVGSDSPAGPVWTPWPERIFKRFGQMCMAVPTTASNWFGKLVPGRQFPDDFSDTWGPFTNRNSYMDWFKEPGEEWFVTNGVLRLTAIHSDYAGFLLLPIGTNAAATLQDFYTSVDILDWVTSGTNWSTFSLVGRGVIVSETYAYGYIGGLSLNYDGIAGNVRLWMYNGAGELRGPSFDMGTNPPPYRLEFSGVGNPICQLRLRVLNPTTKELIREWALVGTAYTAGWPGFWINTRNQAGDTFAITADNYFATGTKP
jgi:hypothetical protein